jgi:hypothetical protein
VGLGRQGEGQEWGKGSRCVCEREEGEPERRDGGGSNAALFMRNLILFAVKTKFLKSCSD